MQKKVLCFGEVLWDAFGDVKKAGGAPMNVARHLAQQGIGVQLASRLGADVPGDELTGFLKSTGLYSTLIQQDEDLPTCEVTVQLDAHKQATYVIPEPVSWDNITANDDLITAAKKAQAIVFGSLACRGGITRNTLRTMLDESSALKVFDVNLRAPHYRKEIIETLINQAQVVKMNNDEADLLISGSGSLQDKVTEFQKAYHSQTIIVTRGAEGALVWHDEHFYAHPGYQVAITDTVGAGDAFLATFIAGLLRNGAIPQVLDRACKIGAFVTTQRGANPLYPAGLMEVR